MAEDHRVKNTSEAHHNVLELLLDTLGLTQVDRFNMNDILELGLLHHLNDLWVDVVSVSNEEDELSQATLQELLRDGGSDSTSGACQEHTFTLEFALEIKRGQVALGLFFDLGNRSLIASGSCSPISGFNRKVARDTSEEVSKAADQVSLTLTLSLGTAILLLLWTLLHWSLWELLAHFCFL